MDDDTLASDQPAASRDGKAFLERGWIRVGRVAVLALSPLLFAAASVFTLYASNLRELYFADVAVTLAAALGLAFVLFLGFAAALRNLRAKEAILASITLVAGLFYAELVDTANRYFGGSLSPAATLAITLVTVALMMVAVVRARGDLTSANVVLICIAFSLFIFPAWQVASHEWNAAGFPRSADAFDDNESKTAAALAASVPAGSMKAPDIYYFIFDRYGSRSVLADHYDFDNGDLIGFLEQRGFYVASDSHANYLKTAHSVASTFHMGYLDFLKGSQRSKLGDWHPIYDMLKGHRVGRFLKAKGYKFIQIGAWWGPTQYNPYADENYSFGLGEFANRYLRKTIVPPVLNAVAPNSPYARLLQWDNGQCQRVPRQIEKVKEVGLRRETTFVFAHILVPHDPYVFSPSGRCLFPEEMAKHTVPEAYIDQVRYANALIKDFVPALLNTEGPEPIIIIQADEGPFPMRYRSGNRSWREATVEELKTKMGILNAFYFPDGDYRDLDRQITSVNTFRIVFNKYFGTKLQRLADRLYAFPDIFKIYDFYDITDLVRGGHRKAVKLKRRIP